MYMRQTEDIIQKLLRIRKARELSEQPQMSEEEVEALREFIIENRRQLTHFAMSHFDRLEASGKMGIAEVVDKKCSACGARISDDEIAYLQKNKNIGVCDNCFAFIYMDGQKFAGDDEFFADLLRRARAAEKPVQDK